MIFRRVPSGATVFWPWEPNFAARGQSWTVERGQVSYDYRPASPKYCCYMRLRGKRSRVLIFFFFHASWLAEQGSETLLLIVVLARKSPEETLTLAAQLHARYRSKQTSLKPERSNDGSRKEAASPWIDSFLHTSQAAATIQGAITTLEVLGLVAMKAKPWESISKWVRNVSENGTCELSKGGMCEWSKYLEMYVVAITQNNKRKKQKKHSNQFDGNYQ